MMQPLKIRHRCRAPRHVVFDLWTDPTHLVKWFHPPGWEMHVAELQMEAGGRFRLGFREEGSTDRVYVGGVYEEITPPERIVMTWTWEDPDPHAGFETRISVSFIDQGAETELEIVQARLTTRDIYDRHAEGWDGAIRLLDGYVRELTSPACLIRLIGNTCSAFQQQIDDLHQSATGSQSNISLAIKCGSISNQSWDFVKISS